MVISKEEAGPKVVLPVVPPSSLDIRTAPQTERSLPAASLFPVFHFPLKRSFLTFVTVCATSHICPRDPIPSLSGRFAAPFQRWLLLLSHCLVLSQRRS